VLLGLIALATLAQTLVTSVRARRTDLAVLKTIGFSRRQVRAAVAWQASALVSVALVIGIPAGLAAGRWIWRAFSDGIAVVPVAVFRPWWIVAAAVVTVAVANLIAAIPSRAAARTHPAVVLRSE
jgi:ABC-type antimicrobial peptide transport system permease subunit